MTDQSQRDLVTREAAHSAGDDGPMLHWSKPFTFADAVEIVTPPQFDDGDPEDWADWVKGEELRLQDRDHYR